MTAINISPLSLALAALGISGTANVIGYMQLVQRPPSEYRPPVGRPTPATGGAVAKRAEVVAMVDSAAARKLAPAAAPPSADEVANWLAAVNGGDAAMRGWAIWSLGSAHKADALPVLRTVVRTGSVEDRDIALEALSTLAREQGDADGAIRSVLRDATYHGDDEDALFTARTTLDDVENRLAQSSPPEQY